MSAGGGEGCAGAKNFARAPAARGRRYPLTTYPGMLKKANVYMTFWLCRAAQRTHTRSNTRTLPPIAPQIYPRSDLPPPDLPRMFSRGHFFAPSRNAMDPCLGGFWGGSRFAPSHARRPLLWSPGGPPGYLKFFLQTHKHFSSTLEPPHRALKTVS